MMELSALMAQLQSKGVKLSLRPNYKTYYNKFPHIIRFHCNQSTKDWAKIRALHVTTTKHLYDSLDESEFRTRSEYYTLAVYCYDLVKVLQTISVSSLKDWGVIEIGEMTTVVQEESSIKPELPKARTTVVKRLPHNTWRYRVHWQPGFRTMQKIGVEALSAIVDQINNDPNTKSFDERTSQRIKRGNYWGTTYFYTNSEDVLCLITLITPLFIKKIEKFTTLEELNEKRTG